jgi:hypothetical protein
MEEGGFFMGLDFVYWRMPNPLWSQTVAVRGFMDFDSSITGEAPGTFVGSGASALNVEQVHGPGTYTPGSYLTLGWRFENGTVFSVNWRHLTDVRYTAQATLVPFNFQFGQDLEDTFLFSPVVAFPNDYAGNPRNVSQGNEGATFGIWNAASFMQIVFLQRYESVDGTLRIPTWTTYDSRCYGLLGPRFTWIWERFKWRTVDMDESGLASASTVAYYSYVVSNRLYGVHAGCGYECFLGDTPIGGFALSVEGEGALFANFVKARAKWELEDRSTVAHRNRNFSTIAPGVSAKINLWWYPLEAIQVTLGYDAEVYFNTMASRHPIDFDFSAITPGFDKNVTRFFHGLHFGFGITF